MLDQVTRLCSSADDTYYFNKWSGFHKTLIKDWFWKKDEMKIWPRYFPKKRKRVRRLFIDKFFVKPACRYPDFVRPLNLINYSHRGKLVNQALPDKYKWKLASGRVMMQGRIHHVQLSSFA